VIFLRGRSISRGILVFRSQIGTPTSLLSPENAKIELAFRLRSR
jgi:hypothetical protein